jgi:prophage regulatory protein
MAQRILRIRDVQAATGLSRPTIYRKISSKKFPAPVVLGTQTVGWHEHEIDAWINSLQPSSIASTAA